MILLLITGLSGCDSKSLNNRITLWRNDKIPYGTYYAFENLHHIFPYAYVQVIKRSPDINKSSALDQDEPTIHTAESDEPSAYLIVSSAVIPDEKEVNELLTFISEGHQVFISSLEIGKLLLDTLRLETAETSGLNNYSDSLNLSILDPVSGEKQSYGYPGIAMDNYFSQFDSSITTILGYNEQGKPNFVRFSYEGGGSIYLQIAPAAFTNFFLLNKQNHHYYDQALSYMSSDIENVYWDDYYRYHQNGEENNPGRKNAFSKLNIFLQDEILRWPLYLSIILFAFLYFFESKRKQRIIPRMSPSKNTSLDFVKTIGRLYYQRKDNKDLTYKMVAHFLDQIRNRYNIPTSVLNEGFAQRLSFKSGYDIKAVNDLIYQIKYLQHQPAVSDESLLMLHHKFENFYKNT